MVASDQEVDSADQKGEMAQKVHSVLEGRGDNECSYQQIKNLTDNVCGFYNQFEEYVEKTETNEKFIQLSFELFLKDQEYADKQYNEAVQQLAEEPSSFSYPGP